MTDEAVEGAGEGRQLTAERDVLFALLGQMAVTLGFFYFVVTQLR